MIALCGSHGAAEAARPISASYPEHTRAVELARGGDLQPALGMLSALVAEFPHDYALRRDYLLVASWSGDCTLVLRQFVLLPEAAAIEPYVVAPVHDCAVRKAREGDAAAALASLSVLEKRAPGDSRIASDRLLIMLWHGDCAAAADRYEQIADPRHLEAYVVAPLAGCLLRRHRAQQALALTSFMLERNPDDEALRQAHARTENAWRLKGGADPGARYLDLRLARQQPEQGTREWLVETTAGMPLADTAGIHVRYLLSRSRDTVYANGEMNRAGVGLRYAPSERWHMSLEMSGDLRHAAQEGLSASISHLPSEASQFWLSYAGYAEDSPLRGRTIGIRADKGQLGAATRSFDYRWEGRAVASRYQFTDGNRRENLLATAGHAYEMQAHREQRIFFEWYASRNSLANTVYFSPSGDSSFGIVHRTSFLRVSAYRRHIDHLQFWINDYRQSGYPGLRRWGARFEQEYDFDERSTFSWGAAFMRNAYDGAYENEARFDARYRRRF